MPPGDGTPEDDYPTRVQRAVAGYVRGQLLFSVAWARRGRSALWIFGVLGIFPDGKTYAFAFGVFFGLMELVPFVGPFLGALPPVLVALFQDPLTALWVGLLFLALQQLEGHVVAPQRLRPHAADQPAARDLRAAASAARSRASSARSSRCRSPRSSARRSSTCAATSCSSRGGPRSPRRSRRAAPALPPGRDPDAEEEREEVPSRT